MRISFVSLAGRVVATWIAIASSATKWSGAPVCSLTANAFVVVQSSSRAKTRCYFLKNRRQQVSSRKVKYHQNSNGRRHIQNDDNDGIGARRFLSNSNTTNTISTPLPLPLPGDSVDTTPVAFGAIPDALSSTSVAPSAAAMAELGQSQQQQQDRLELPLTQLALAGSLTTLFSDIIMHPVDCIKVS